MREEVHSAVLQARWVLVLIGAGLVAFHGSILVNVGKLAESLPVPVDAKTGEPPTDDEVEANRARFRELARLSSGWNIGAGVVAVACAGLLPLAPPAFVVIAALFFLGVQVGLGVLEPTTILNGIVVKIAIIAGLFTVTRKVLEAETGQRAF
ncbi:MAG: hypothetical protein ACKO9Z_00755 [Planctomycetota bacterium]